MDYNKHVIDHEVSQLSEELATFMDTYRATLVNEVRMSVPLLVQLAVAIEEADSMADLIAIKVEMAEFIKAIRYLTPKN